METKASKWVLPAVVSSGLLVAVASFYVVYDGDIKPTIVSNTPKEPISETSQRPQEPQELQPSQEVISNDNNVATDNKPNNYIEEHFKKLGHFVKTEGQWKQKSLLVSSVGDIVYRSDEDQMTIRLQKASFGWNENKPKEMSSPTVDFMEVTIPWPMVEPRFAEIDNFWDVVGDMNIKEGRVRIVQALNEAQEIAHFSFKDLKRPLGEDYIGRTLDDVMRGIYELSVKAMLNSSLDETKAAAENTLAFLLGMPVNIGSLEGDLNEGNLIFEDVRVGSKDDPFMTFASGKVKYQLMKDDIGKTSLNISNLELFEPTTYVKFSEEMNEDGQPNENILPILQRVTQQYDDLYKYRDRMYIPIVYNNVQVGNGVIVTTQKDSVKRTQVPKLAFDQNAFKTITEAGTSPTYGLIGGYLGSLGQASLNILANLQNANGGNTTATQPMATTPTDSNAAAPTNGGLESVLDQRLGINE
ncbi:MAG: hypothetical protein ACK5MJ_00380 [Alphaproteobacteria bacterium]